MPTLDKEKAVMADHRMILKHNRHPTLAKEETNKSLF